MIGLWVKLLTIPYHLLFPIILVFSAIGVFSVNNSGFDVYLMALFGVLGYGLSKLECEPAPLLLGFILGPMMEENMRRALVLARGDFTVFVTRPISAAMLLIAVVALVAVLSPVIRRKREEAFQEEA
jgi:TctA family transporter